MSDHWTDRLPRDCCKDAVAWCRSFDTPEAAWSVCERGDWMMWILRARAGLSGAVAVYAAIIAAYAAYAADAAADAADAADAAAYAANAAAVRPALLKQEAQIIREHFPQPPRLQ